MDETETEKAGAGGRASLLALAGTVTFVIGLILTALLGPIGVFFVALGGAILLASPGIWLLMVWNDRSDG